MTRVGVALVLVVAAGVLSRRQGLGLERQLTVSVIRALVQLVAVALVIETVFGQLGLSGVFVAVMLGAGSWTAAGRWHAVPGARRRAGVAIGVSVGAVLLVVFASGAFELTPRFLIPLAGLVTGGSTVAAGVAGRRLSEEIADHLAVIEARLALGEPARAALAPHARRAVATALIPAVDQTKNVGLITLPGAFVGMLLGGASPLEAAEVQLTVLFVLLGAETIAATMAAALVARSHVRPGERVIPWPA